MASQMAPAVFDTTTVDFDIPSATQPDIGRSATCSARPAAIVKFQGFLALYREAREEGRGQGARGRAGAAGRSTSARRCRCKSITPSQHFTEPPPRFSEASLVKELERLGIGRPSTYASIISDARRSPLRRARAASLLPDASSARACEKVMVKQFPDVFNVGFTSRDGRGARQDRGRHARLAESRSRTSTTPFAELAQRRRRRRRSSPRRTICRRSTNERCPDCGGKLDAEGRILRAVRRLRESSEDVQVHASDQGRARSRRS